MAARLSKPTAKFFQTQTRAEWHIWLRIVRHGENGQVCDSVEFVQRAPAILVVLALLSTPLALLARSVPAMTGCACMCSVVYKSLSSPAGRKHAKAMCGHCPSEQHCAMKAPGTALDFGLNTLMAPTQSSSRAAIRVPVIAPLDFQPLRQSIPAGLLPAPFEPPRR